MNRCCAMFVLVPLVLFGCAETLPSDIAGYRERDDCHKMNASLLPKRDDDPHEGEKNVYACGIELARLQSNERPFPDGVIIVKESIQAPDDFPWLVATARKSDGSWRWNEYSRNFADEELVHIIAGEQVCVDCHQKAKAADWIYTFYAARPSAGSGERP